MLSNRSLQKLDIRSSEGSTADQVDSLQEAITGRHLKELCLWDCEFGNGGSRWIARTNLLGLHQRGRNVYYISGYSALLRDPTDILQHLSVASKRTIEINNDEIHDIIRQIASSLAGNTKLRELDIHFLRAISESSVRRNKYYKHLQLEPYT